jgi:hypothetical protein
MLYFLLVYEDFDDYTYIVQKFVQI